MSDDLLKQMAKDQRRANLLEKCGITLLGLSVASFAAAFFGFWGTSRALSALSDPTDPWRTKFFEAVIPFLMSGSPWAMLAYASILMGMLGGAFLSLRR